SACTGAAKSAGTSSARRSRRAARTSSARTGTAGARSTTATGAAEAAAAAAESTTAATTNIHATQIALAHGSVPGGLDLTGFHTRQDSQVVHDVGIRGAADRAILVLERRAPPARAALVVAPLALDRREIC